MKSWKNSGYGLYHVIVIGSRSVLIHKERSRGSYIVKFKFLVDSGKLEKGAEQATYSKA
jgi:hypothetical protein